MENLKFDKLVDTVLEKKEKIKLPPTFRQGGGQRQSGSGYHTTDKQKAFSRQNLKRQLDKEISEAIENPKYFGLADALAEKWRTHIALEISGKYKDVPKPIIRSALDKLVAILNQMSR